VATVRGGDVAAPTGRESGGGKVPGLARPIGLVVDCYRASWCALGTGWAGASGIAAWPMTCFVVRRGIGSRVDERTILRLGEFDSTPAAAIRLV
jgi:hypothetical protein